MHCTRHVAIFLPNFGGGGAERVNLDLSDALLKRGVRVTFVVTDPGGELAGQVPTDAEVLCIGPARTRALISPMRRALLSLRPDVWVVVMWPYTIPGVLAARLSSLPIRCVVQDHCAYSALPEFSGGLKRLLSRICGALVYRVADERIAVSKGIATDAGKLFAMRMDRWKVIYNALPTRHQDVDYQRTVPKSGTHRLLSVGRLSKEKGFDTLIKAVSLMPEVDLHVSILGDGPCKNALSSLITQMKLDGKISLVGFVHDTAKYYAESDVFVLASRYEGFPLVLLEALAYGLKIVSTDCRVGPREVLKDGQFGILVPVDDPKALADAIRAILSRSIDSDRLRQRAEEFSPKNFIDQHYSALLPNDQF